MNEGKSGNDKRCIESNFFSCLKNQTSLLVQRFRHFHRNSAKTADFVMLIGLAIVSRILMSLFLIWRGENATIKRKTEKRYVNHSFYFFGALIYFFAGESQLFRVAKGAGLDWKQHLVKCKRKDSWWLPLQGTGEQFHQRGDIQRIYL